VALEKARLNQKDKEVQEFGRILNFRRTGNRSDLIGNRGYNTPLKFSLVYELEGVETPSERHSELLSTSQLNPLEAGFVL
jgi:hypothetical protein